MNRTPWMNEAMLLLVVAVWGLNFPIAKGVLGLMHPHVFNALRFIVSTGVLGALYLNRRRRTGLPFFQPLRDHPWKVAGLGLIGFGFYQLFFIVGLDRTTAGNAALIMASAPLWTALVGYFLSIERLRGAAWLSLFVVLAGAVLIVLGGDRTIDFSSRTFVGNLIMLGASFFWGSYTALCRPVLRTVSASALAFLSLLFALPVLLAAGIPYMDDVAWERMTAWTWLAIIYSGGLSTGLAVAMWNTAVNDVGASQTAVFGNLTPVVAVVASALILHEPITLPQIVGGGLIIGGLIWMRRTRGVAPVIVEEPG